MHQDYGIPNGKFSSFHQLNLRPQSQDYEGILIVVSEWRAGRVIQSSDYRILYLFVKKDCPAWSATYNFCKFLSVNIHIRGSQISNFLFIPGQNVSFFARKVQLLNYVDVIKTAIMSMGQEFVIFTKLSRASYFLNWAF